MKLIIDIDEQEYNDICENGYVYDEDNEYIAKVIANSTPLEDELDKLKAEIEQMDFDFGDYYDYTDTIIEMVSKVIDNHIERLKEENIRDCETCIHSDNGKIAPIEICHDCMWNSKWKLKRRN